MDVIKKVGPSESRPDLLGRAAMNLSARPQAFPRPRPHQADLYLGFFMRTLHFAAFSHMHRHPQATAVGIRRKGEARGWIQERVRKVVSNPERWHRKPIDQIMTIFCRLFRRIGSCRYP